MLHQIVRGPLLIPRDGGSVDYFVDGALAANADGVIEFAGDWRALEPRLGSSPPAVRLSEGVMLPPLLDLHTHISQHPIRGRFVEGVPDDAPRGKLVEGLRRNVFPAEARCADPVVATEVTRAFLADTLSHGVVGGAAYMTASAAATDIALSILPATWQVGMVLMDQNCPPNVRSDEANIEVDTERLFDRFGSRVIATDRFALTVSSPLRRRVVALAKRLGLRTQTHLNEQVAEKVVVERDLYPDAASYTDVYRRDGLLDHRCILAHCIQMRPEEWRTLADTGSVVAHCPTSNLLLGSGVMSLNDVKAHGIDYAIATDVGASPTVSMLAELGRFLGTHRGRSNHATPAEALYRSTLAPAKILQLDQQLGRLQPGRPMSFIEVEPAVTALSTDDAILSLLPAHLDHPTTQVRQVTLDGRII